MGKRIIFSLLALFFLLAFTSKGSADTNVSGIISDDQIWTLANSPYIVAGNILVSEGVALTIEPGVNVKFDGDYYIKIDGALIANGTASSQIVFTSNNVNPSAGNWKELNFTGSSIDAAIDDDSNYVSGSRINYTVIEYGGGILIQNAFPYISNSIFRYNSGTSNPMSSYIESGVLTFQHQNIIDNNKTIIIKNNIIENNSAAGIGGGLDNDATFPCSNIKVVIQNNKIRNNDGTGLLYGDHDDYSDEYTILFSHNLIYQNNSGGVYISRSDSDDIFEYNIIANNSGTHYGYAAGIEFYNGSAAIRYNNIINNSISADDSPIAHDSGSAIGNGYCCVDASITYNTILNNTGGSSFYFESYNVNHPTPTINYNNILNPSNAYEFYSDQKLYDTDMTNNWWGTTDTQIIDSKIYDFYDDFYLAEVIYNPILLSPDAIAPISPPTYVSSSIEGDALILTWSENPESDLAGYRIYYDTDSGFPYTNFIDVGNVTTFTLSNLNTSNTYYISVTAYDTGLDGTDDQFDGNESWFSSEIIGDYSENGDDSSGDDSREGDSSGDDSGGSNRDGGGSGGGGIFGTISFNDVIGYHLDGIRKDGTRIYMPVTEGFKALKGAQTQIEGFAPGLAKFVRRGFESLEERAESNKDGLLYSIGTHLFPVLGKIAGIYLEAVDSKELMTNAYKDTIISVSEYNRLHQQGIAVAPHVVIGDDNY